MSGEIPTGEDQVKDLKKKLVADKNLTKDEIKAFTEAYTANKEAIIKEAKTGGSELRNFILTDYKARTEAIVGRAGVEEAQAYFISQGAKIAKDGAYGPDTIVQVIDYQIANNLTVDGILGNQVLASIREKSGNPPIGVGAAPKGIKRAAGPQTGSTEPLSQAGTRTLDEKGKLIGDRTKEVQAILASAGVGVYPNINAVQRHLIQNVGSLFGPNEHYLDPKSPEYLNGVYGPQTVEAMKKLQVAFKVTPTGIPDAKLLRNMQLKAVAMSMPR